jgi:hypothetical protein
VKNIFKKEKKYWKNNFKGLFEGIRYTVSKNFQGIHISIEVVQNVTQKSLSKAMQNLNMARCNQSTRPIDFFPLEK